MNKEKEIVNDLGWFANYFILEINKKESEKGSVSDYDNGYRKAFEFVLERIEKYEKEIDND